MWKECLNCGLDVPLNEEDILKGFVFCPACNERIDIKKLNAHEPEDIGLLIREMIEVQEENRIKLNNKLKTKGFYKSL